MARIPSSVRVRVVRLDGESFDSREGFWRALGDSDATSHESAIGAESRFRREFGRHLGDQLVAMFASAIRQSDFESIDRLFEGFLMRFGTRERSPFYGDAFTRWIEARQQEFVESPALRAARENRVLARQVCFTVAHVSYSSLLFDVDFGPIEKVATIFDHNFDAFQVFLNAFVPVAFAESTSDDFANARVFQIDATDETRRLFEAVVPVSNTPPQPSASPTSSLAPVGAREKAEWLWRLANGSLLVPFLIALLVMLYGLRELSAINRYQQEQLKPILEHHLELLKEDRLRLEDQGSLKQESKASPPATTTTVTTKTP